jgi:DUF309 family protein family protein
MTVARRTIVGPDGRAKAYRPLPADVRATAVHDGLAAYERGDFFLAHELMEPAWMGSDDQAERALTQGLIKLAAAQVHAVRGNPRGVAKNLEGALGWLRLAADAGMVGPEGLDLPALIRGIEDRLAGAVAGATGVRGSAGAEGSTRANGSTGAEGSTRADGAAGAEGSTRADGSAGAEGSAPVEGSIAPIPLVRSRR